MKKYKVHFSLFNLFDTAQKEVVRLQSLNKALVATITGTALYTSNPTFALWIAVGGFFVDVLLGCLYFKKV